MNWNPRSWFKPKQPENSALATPESWLVEALLSGMKSAAGVSVSAPKILGLATVYACVNVISRTVGTLPARLHRRNPNGKGSVVALDHPAHNLLSFAPNAEMTTVDFRRAMQATLSLHNSAFAEIVRDARGRPSALWPIHPSNIEKRRDASTGNLYFEFIGELRGRGRRDPDEILHLKGLTFDGQNGVDLLDAERDVFGLAIALETNAAKFFANDSKPGTILQSDGKLSEKAFERLKQGMEERQGVDNAHRFMILEEGLKVAAGRMANRESQLDESRARQALDVCRIFGIPPHKIQILDNATFSNIEEQQIDFISDCIQPIAVTWEAALNRWLLTDADRAQGHFFKIDLRGLLRGKMLERAEYYTKLSTVGAMSPNEIRELEDMTPVEGLDYYSRPLNTEKVGEVENSNTGTK